MIDADDREEWGDLLDRLEEPPAQELVDRVADTYDVSKLKADEVVFAAIDDGPLVEDNDAGGAYGVVRVAEERDYTPDEDEPTPLERYQYSGYAYGDEDDDEIRAIDASVWFTASNIGPAFAADIDDAGEWWQPGYSCACAAVEEEIVDALLADREADDNETDDGDSESANPSKTAESNPEEPESEDENPGCGDDSPAVEEDAVVANQQSADDTAESLVSDEGDLAQRSLEAFAAAVEFFNSQLDRDISDAFEDAPDTPRAYYTEYRGWDEDTIADKQLGYAPADERALLDYLMRKGFDGDAIQGTGLFYEDFTPHFQGRYVLPYFDADGRPVYAISRSLNAHEDGHPRDPKGDQKYTKAIKTKDRTYVDEPIYGRETVDDDTDRLLVAGGIADALTLHEAGYACISPVTTVRFKNKHEAVVVDLVEEHDLDGVYMLNDAERPSVDKTELEDGEEADSIGQVLTIKQYGEGQRAAFGNAEFLLEEGVDPYLAELPGGDDYIRKLDPDDYIKEQWGSVETLLSNADHAEYHDGYTEWEGRRRAREVDKAIQTGDGSGDAGSETALYDLTFPQVSGMEIGDRQNNPLGHHGNSEGYFVCAEKHGFVHGYDHKYNVAYNAVSFLLCDAGARRADDPSGRLSDYEVFVAWKHAKENRHLPEDDPVPYRGLRGIAVEDGLLDREELVERDSDTGEIADEDADADTYTALPSGTYNDVLQHIRDEHGVEPGREEVAGTREDGEPEAALPLERLDALDREEARRFASKRGVEWPTTREARERLRNKIMDTMHHGDMKVIDAPTALGKSYTVATEPWLRRSSTTGDAPVVQFSETRPARDQAAAHSEDAGVDAARLLGRSEACPVAAGAHDPAAEDEKEPEVVITMNGQPASEWFEAVCDGDGVPFSVAHTYLDDHNDQNADLPCCDGGGECPAIAQWDGLPWNDDAEPAVDVIHATHGFAHVPSLRNGTNMIFDEEPDFSVELSHERVRNAVAAYLKVADAPVTDYERFVARARKGEDEPANEHSENQYIRDALDYEPEREWYLEADGSHTLAPALTKAIYYALRPEEGGVDADASDANGRYNATVGHEPPRLDKEANDEEGWNRVWVSVVLDEDNTVRTVRSTPDTMAARSVIGLDAHPCVEKWQRNAHPDIMPQPVLNPDERRLWRRFERGLSVVGVGDATRPLTSGEYFDEGGTRAFLQSLRDHYGDQFRTAITAASVEHRTEELLEEVGVGEPDTMHYGEEKSRGDFGDEDVGALNGCIDPGDDFVLDLLAEAGLEATPETNTNDDGEEYRAKGRGFEGPDADAAERLLASVRENHVAQAAGRYARNADDSDDSAVVFVRTDAVPDGYLDLTVPGVKWVPTDRQQEIIGELRRRTAATTREIADATDNSKEHVRQTLERLKENDHVECREHAADHGAHLYRALAGLGEGDLVELTPTTNDGVCNSYTWSLAVSRPETEFRTRLTVDTPESTPSPPDRSSKQVGLGADTNVDPPS